jgi:NAD+ kinase
MDMYEPAKLTPRIAVSYHPSIPEAAKEARDVFDYLKDRQVKELTCLSLYDDNLRKSLQSGDYDFLIALGGDGTMLRAGRLCAPLNVPVLGINAGHFGFLTELSRDEWRVQLPLLLEGRYRLENRMMLRSELWRGENMLEAWDVLNEVVVCRGQFVRPIQLAASVDGFLMNLYVADGLIAATPTGSTAYALAAGGPIMPPELDNILIIPVAPHLSMDRAIILSQGVKVSISVQTSHEAVLSVDGRPPVMLMNDDTVVSFAGEHRASFVRFKDQSYFYRNITRYMEQNPSASGAR